MASERSAASLAWHSSAPERGHCVEIGRASISWLFIFRLFLLESLLRRPFSSIAMPLKNLSDDLHVVSTNTDDFLAELDEFDKPHVGALIKT